MTDKQDRAFNPEAMLGNISHVKSMIQRIRQKDGGIGSENDELCLHRVVHDIDLLADMVATLKLGVAKLKEEAQGQINMLSARIKELETPPSPQQP
tara:strand:+ start:400 stop:687 length:288 start_codon:yes stop_codon:yes gene_type:complete